jgi:hypothetical protein
MDKHGLVERACEGINEHECIVESEGAHHPVAVEGTLAVCESAVADEQAAITVGNVTDNELVATIWKLVNNSIAIAGVKLPHQFTVRCWLQTVINGKGEEQWRREVIGLKSSK